MVKKLHMTREQTQRFCDPIIKFMKKNPHLFREDSKENKTKKQRETPK